MLLFFIRELLKGAVMARSLVCIAFLIVLMNAMASSQNPIVCSYSGAKIIVEDSEIYQNVVDTKNFSPTKETERTVHVENVSKFSETTDYIEFKNNGKSITYPLKCSRH